MYQKLLPILVAKFAGIAKCLPLAATCTRTEVNQTTMKTIKTLALLALAAAALSTLGACKAKTEASSSGVSASTTTTSGGK